MPTTQIEVDDATAARLRALGRGLPAGDVVRSLAHAKPEELRRLELRRAMAEDRERRRDPLREAFNRTR